MSDYCECGPKASFVAETPEKVGPKIGDLDTNNGWWVCSACRKPSRAALNECDTCEKKFKGIRPGIKFAYTCPECA